MRLQVIGSGSSGNCYLLTANDGSRLLIELGCEWSAIKQALDFDYDNVFAIVSHRHGDHSKCVKKALSASIMVVGNSDILELWDERELNLSPFVNFNSLHEYPVRYMGFTIKAFDLIHDVPTQGYLIHHNECGNICFISDTREADFDFPGVRHWLIEANFGEDIIVDRVWKGANAGLAERVTESHMSIEECERVLVSQDLSDTETILLLHLSDSNSHAVQFQQRITKATGKPVYIADKGVILDL